MEKVQKPTYLSSLLRTYPLEDIEATLVDIFLKKNGLEVHHNQLLINAVAKSNLALRTHLEKEIDDFHLRHFVNIFELLIPSNDKKLNGAFFTPKHITHFMSTAAAIRADSTYLDPSCGCGAFLLDIAEKIHTTTNAPFKTIFERQLFGIDIAAYSTHRAKILLSLLALTYGEDASFVFHIETGDTLATNALSLFSQPDGFDVIIGNPPYVKYQDLSDEQRLSMKQDWRTVKNGNYNLYFPFFEIGSSWLAPNGTLIFITPNNYFTSLAGERLRTFLTEEHLLDTIIDFSHLKVFKVSTYTAITVVTKQQKTSLRYGRIDSVEGLQKLPEQSIETVAESTIDYASLKHDKWRLLRNKDQANIHAIESQGTPLGQLFDIKVGIATLADKYYFVGPDLTKTHDAHQYDIEEGITLPIRKISELNKTLKPQAWERRIIFPYQRSGDGVSSMTPEYIHAHFPNAFAYLTAITPELAKRNKGGLTLTYWYEYGRSQALNVSGKRLYTPTFSKQPNFILDESESALFCNGYALFEKTGQSTHSLALIQKILNSSVMDYYATLTSYSIDGGYACYQKNYIERFGVPELSPEESDFVLQASQHDVDAFLKEKMNLHF